MFYINGFTLTSNCKIFWPLCFLKSRLRNNLLTYFAKNQIHCISLKLHLWFPKTSSLLPVDFLNMCSKPEYLQPIFSLYRTDRLIECSLKSAFFSNSIYTTKHIHVKGTYMYVRARETKPCAPLWDLLTDTWNNVPGLLFVI